MNDQHTTLARFSLSERIQHVWLLVTFALLALTGLPQKFPTSDWAPIFIQILGGIYVVRIIHRICAFLLAVGVIYHLVSGIFFLVTKRARFEMLPRWKDFKDVAGNIAYFLGIKKERPRFEHFNYLEKFEYWALLWGTTIMGLTGLILLFPSISAKILPGLAIPAAKAAHSGEAFLAVSAIVIWHMYNAHLSPRVFPINKSIFTGKISKHELMVEHAGEYERTTGEIVPGEMLSQRYQVSWSSLLGSGLMGLVLIGLFAGLLYYSVVPPKPSLNSPFNLPLERDFVNPFDSQQASQPSQIWNGVSLSPTAEFSVSRETVEGSALVEFHFQDMSTGEVTSWLWNFGDGVTSLEQNPSHFYTTQCPSVDNQCTVTLMVCGPGGCDSISKQDAVKMSSK